MKMKIAVSVLAADFARLAEAVEQAGAAGADWVHVDVMDGHFVPNLTIGPPVVAALRRVTDLPLDVHLMIESPERLLAAFRDAGADWLTVHAETCPHLHRTVQQIRELGMRPGVAINPATPLAALDEILLCLDLVLLMTVNPGFGGQAFVPSSTAKVARLRQQLEERRLGALELEVDGGIGPDTAPQVVRAGATVLVAGAAIFNTRASVAENLAALRRAAAAVPHGPPVEAAPQRS
ncbi:MAG: ribulose-phosphate 3-epimerase [Gemmatimonadetes bacterium]|nr:ribulose-phosphate 3-epimerase [Gemmatimonadota bacterium]